MVWLGVGHVGDDNACHMCIGAEVIGQCFHVSMTWQQGGKPIDDMADDVARTRRIHGKGGTLTIVTMLS